MKECTETHKFFLLRAESAELALQQFNRHAPGDGWKGSRHKAGDLDILPCHSRSRVIVDESH
jgi:hypothetical protein